MSPVRWMRGPLLKPCPLSQAICCLIEQRLLLRSTHSWRLSVTQGLSLLSNYTLLVHRTLFAVLPSGRDGALLNVANRLWSLTEAGARRLRQTLLYTYRIYTSFWLVKTSTRCLSVSSLHHPPPKPTWIA